MGLSEVLGIVIIILLLTLILLQITGRKKTDLGEIRLLLKHASDEQRESVQKQIANSTTEQFERFGFIQKAFRILFLPTEKRSITSLVNFKNICLPNFQIYRKAGWRTILK